MTVSLSSGRTMTISKIRRAKQDTEIPVDRSLDPPGCVHPRSHRLTFGIKTDHPYTECAACGRRWKPNGDVVGNSASTTTDNTQTVTSLDFITSVVRKPTQYDVGFRSSLTTVNLDAHVKVIERYGFVVEAIKTVHNGVIFYCTIDA